MEGTAGSDRAALPDPGTHSSSAVLNADDAAHSPVAMEVRADHSPWRCCTAKKSACPVYGPQPADGAPAIAAGIGLTPSPDALKGTSSTKEDGNPLCLKSLALTL